MVSRQLLLWLADFGADLCPSLFALPSLLLLHGAVTVLSWGSTSLTNLPDGPAEPTPLLC